MRLSFHLIPPGRVSATREQTAERGEGADRVGIRAGTCQTEEQGRGPERGPSWQVPETGRLAPERGGLCWAVGAGAGGRSRGALGHPEALENLLRVTGSHWRVLSRMAPASDFRSEAPSG